MAWARATQILYWSWSVFAKYTSCPYKAKMEVLYKIKTPDGPAMDRGNVVHVEGDQWHKGKLRKLPESFAKFAKEMKEFKAAKADSEVSWAWDVKWERCAGDDFKRAWLRIRVDLLWWDAPNKVLHIVDYKTGKDHSTEEDNKEQLRLYRLGGLLMYPDAGRIISELWYVDHGTVAREVCLVTKASLPTEKKYWLKQTRAMLVDKGFAPTPSANACKWCWFKKDNRDFPGTPDFPAGRGPCKF